MSYETIKGYKLNYQLTHIKIKNAIIRVIEKGDKPTVKAVAKEAGISVSTAYSHKCQEMILEILL